MIVAPKFPLDLYEMTTEGRINKNQSMNRSLNSKDICIFILMIICYTCLVMCV